MGAACQAAPLESESPSVELADVFRCLGARYLEENKLTLRQKRAFQNIVECRTAAKGGHLWRCGSCGHERPLFNSCLDRHCPKCQGQARFQWVARRMEELINTPYFHLVFTLPHQLNPLVATNPGLLNLLFEAAAQTLLLFGRDAKFLGGEIGFLAVLHTWDQRLHLHYHLHCIIPGGALSADGTEWIPSKSPRFLFPVAALSKTFRRLYWHGSKALGGCGNKETAELPVSRKIQGLADLLRLGRLKLPGELASLSLPSQLQSFENQLYRKNWFVYAKPPFGTPQQVVKYLGLYTHRVAISNRRILSYNNGFVAFSWKDRKVGNRTRVMTLPDSEFARRFLQHVLPRSFMKIRSFGFLSNTKKKRSISRCRELLGDVSIELSAVDDFQQPEKQPPEQERNRVCPRCRQPTLVKSSSLCEFDRTAARKALWDTS